MVKQNHQGFVYTFEAHVTAAQTGGEALGARVSPLV